MTAKKNQTSKESLSKPLNKNRKGNSRISAPLAPRGSMNTNEEVNGEISALFLQAGEYEKQQNWLQAKTIYEAILEKNPQNARALHSLGLFAFHSQNFNGCLSYFAKAVQSEPSNLIFQRNFGEISRRLGYLENAILAGKAAVKIDPKDLDAHYNLGLAYSDNKDYKNAISIYRKALKLNPKHGLSWNNLGSALELSGNKEAALKAYLKAIEINESHAEAQNNAGAIYSELGDIDKAKNSYEKAISSSPNFIEAHYNLSSLKTYSADDQHLKFLASINLQKESLDQFSRLRFNFAFGKAMEDIGDFDNAFLAYKSGNEIQHSLLPYDESVAEKLVDDIITIFNKDFFDTRKNWGSSEKSPIFIVGMPRSGTTLLEQILSTHDSVYGAGEIIDLNNVITQITKTIPGHQFTEAVKNLNQSDIEKIASEYTSRVWALSPSSQWITDKMPANFFYLGLIFLAFPKAKIIHAMRDPMDSCFSCYARLFNETMEFAYDLETLGRYYNRYIRLMDHWKKVLPKDFILDLRYEQLVDDFENQSKEILSFIGLPWDPKVLNFHKNERIVKTASVAQVRKPIYKSSVARWKNFEKYLQPLVAIVAPERLNNQAIENNSSKDALIVDVKEVKSPESIIEHCLSLQAANRHKEVLEYLSDDLSFGIHEAQALHLKGISYYRLDLFHEAKSSYERALEIQPNFPALLNSYGFLLQDMGLVEEALKAFEKAVYLAPEFSMARLNYGMAQLKLGLWKEGWENYESRWTGSAESLNPQFQKPQCPIPQWDGQEGVNDKTLLVITEQGFGDVFQFSRFLIEASKKFKRVGFVSSFPTLRLMEWSFGNQIILLNQIPTDFSSWSFYCPLMSLPRAFGTRLDSIPNNTPYLKTISQPREYWKDRLNKRARSKVRIGLAWAGRKTHQYDHRRSISLDLLFPILSSVHVSWVSLQKWSPQDLRPSLPAGIDWIDWTDDLSDFADTASLIENLDLIISVDSSLVHLSAALGKKVWMLNRFDSEWRWLLRQSTSPWYSSLRIFNQPSFGDWESVLRDLKQKLSEEFSNSDISDQSFDDEFKNISTTENNSFYLSDSSDINGLLQRAGQLHSAGRLLEAEEIINKIVSLDPSAASAYHLLGLISYQKGEHKKAVDVLKIAIEKKPDEALFCSNLGEILRQTGDLESSIHYGKMAVQLNPGMATAHSNLGIAFYDLGLIDESIEAHQKALAIEPRLIQSLNNMGSIARARKNGEEAISWYNKALNYYPDYLESLSNLGAVLVENERPSEAITVLNRALKLAPNYPEALCNIGLAYIKSEDYDLAKEYLDRSLQVRKNYSEALSGLARVCQERDQLEDAISLLMLAQSSGKDRPDLHSQLGIIYTELGYGEEAKNAFLKSLSLDPNSTDALNGLANLKVEEGFIDEAIDEYSQILGKNPDNIEALFQLVQIKKVKNDDFEFIELQKALNNSDKLPDNKKISVSYALGKAYEDLGNFDLAFEHFEAGAKLKRSKLSYDPKIEKKLTDEIIEVFSAERLAKLKDVCKKKSSSLPIFILGMPRSGTTLTEQIISSHPLVYGAGELRELANIITSPQAADGSPGFPKIIETIDKKTLQNWSQRYLKFLKGFDKNALKITDKMPSNYILIGLIHILFPDAKIIHVKRNPIDTCLSCYTRLFNRYQEATYDLEELGQQYLNYVKLMNHWNAILPKNSIYEICYENIVADTENEAKKLIEYCGLEWNDQCLEFYNSKRVIKTASVAQVRQPIYKSSVEKWRRYEKQLAPLIKTLSSIM